MQAFMVVLVTCKNEEALFKNEGAESSQHFSHYKSIGIFPDAQRQLTLKTLVQFCGISKSFKMLLLCTLPARIKKIQSKIEGANVLTTFYIEFSDAQGQLTP